MALSVDFVKEAFNNLPETAQHDFMQWAQKNVQQNPRKTKPKSTKTYKNDIKARIKKLYNIDV